MENQNINLSIIDETSLKQMHKFEKNKKKADRIKTILLLNKGFSYKEVSEILLLDDKTIRTIEK
jgi:hypothetical protein